MLRRIEFSCVIKLLTLGPFGLQPYLPVEYFTGSCAGLLEQLRLLVEYWLNFHTRHKYMDLCFQRCSEVYTFKRKALAARCKQLTSNSGNMSRADPAGFTFMQAHCTCQGPCRST